MSVVTVMPRGGRIPFYAPALLERGVRSCVAEWVGGAVRVRWESRAVVVTWGPRWWAVLVVYALPGDDESEVERQATLELLRRARAAQKRVARVGA